MPRLIVSLMVAVLLVMASSTIAAQSPTASPAMTEQPAATVWTFPEQGVTVAFPADWDVTREEAASLPWLVLSASSGTGDLCGITDLTTAVSYRAALPIGSLDEWLAATLARWSHDLAARDVASEVLELPAGRVGRVTMDTLDVSPQADWTALEPSGRYAMYLLGDGDRWFLLDCSASDSPADDWLSIARTFEFLPEE